MANTEKAEKLWAWVDQRCEDLNIVSIRELERRSGTSYGAIARPRSDMKMPTYELSEKMSKALHVDITQFWKQAGVSTTREVKTGAEADILRLLEHKDEAFKRQVAAVVKIMVEIDQ